jgi:hypothetical protein
MLTFQSFRARRPIGTLHPETALRKEEITSCSLQIRSPRRSSSDCPIVSHEWSRKTARVTKARLWVASGLSGRLLPAANSRSR